MSITSAKSGATGISLALENNFMEPIASTLVGAGGVNTVIFNDIPQTYKHLQIRMSICAASSGNMLMFSLNGDSSSNVAIHSLGGNGASAYANAATGVQYLRAQRQNTITATASTFTAGIIDILDYTNTNKYKTIRVLSGTDQNGSGAVDLESNLWQSIDAINSISLFPANSVLFAQYSRISLYGIKG